MLKFQARFERWPVTVLLGVLTLALAACGNDKGSDNGLAIVVNDSNGAAYDPIIDPANFVSNIDNPYFTLKPGSILVYEGVNESKEKVRKEVEVTREKKTIRGVSALVIRDRVWEGGELVEDTDDWYAQDKDGNVWYFGEDSKQIEKGKVASTEGSWQDGVKGAKAGIIMKGRPQVGDAYRQEFLKGEAEGLGQIVGINKQVTTKQKSYDNCIVIKEWTPQEPKITEQKFYCPDAGNLVFEEKTAGESGRMELIEIRTS